MKRLLLMRHAKSDWDAAYGADHDRPLSTRGINAAGRMGRFIAEAGLTPDTVFASTATRAAETVRLAAEEGGWPDVPVRHSASLYGAGPGTIFRHVRSADDAATTVLVAGHEPGWSHAVSDAIGGGAVRMPTACLACIQFNIASWSELMPGDGLLICLVPPRLLDG